MNPKRPVFTHFFIALAVRSSGAELQFSNVTSGNSVTTLAIGWNRNISRYILLPTFILHVLMEYMSGRRCIISRSISFYVRSKPMCVL